MTTGRRSIRLTVRDAGDIDDTSDTPTSDNAGYIRIAYTAHQALCQVQRLRLQEYRLSDLYQKERLAPILVAGAAPGWCPHG